MTKTKGYVTYLGGTTYKGQKLYSFRLKNQDLWFRCGTAEPAISKDDLIEFEYEEKDGFANVDLASIRSIDLSTSSDVPEVRTAEYRVNSGGLSKDDYWKNKELRDLAKDDYYKANDLRIQYQSARNAAITVVDVLLREKLLKLAKDGDNVAVVIGKIDDLTNDFFAKCSNMEVANSGS